MAEIHYNIYLWRTQKSNGAKRELEEGSSVTKKVFEIIDGTQERELDSPAFVLYFEEEDLCRSYNESVRLKRLLKA